MNGLARIRRGLGVIFVLAGLLHAVQMVFAVLYSLGRLRVFISARLWSEMYYAHFLFMVLAGGIYLFLSYRRGGLFYPEALVDFLVAVGVFIILIAVVGIVLVRDLVTPWASLIPGAFLTAYGIGLWRGRRMGFGAGS